MEKLNTNKLSFKIKNRHGDNLNADLRYPNDAVHKTEKLPLLIFCHGFKGFKDWGCFPYMLEKIAGDGNYVLSFNFSYNGTGDEEINRSEFTRLELFAENTLSRELEDLESVIDFVFQNKKDFHFDTENLILSGHSRGGGTVIIKTGEDKRIRKLVTLAAVCNFDRYGETMLKKWKEDGYIETLNTRTNQLMRMNYTLVDDYLKNKERLDIQKAVSKINIPYLIIHGKQDLSVDYSNAEDIYSRSNKDLTKLVLLENTGHTFGAVHPFAGTSKALEEVIMLINEFIKQ